MSAMISLVYCTWDRHQRAELFHPRTHVVHCQVAVWGSLPDMMHAPIGVVHSLSVGHKYRPAGDTQTRCGKLGDPLLL